MTQLALTSVWTTQLLNTVSNSICVIKMAHTVRHFFCLIFSRLLHPFRFIYRRIILHRQARRSASAGGYHHRISCPPGQRAFKLRLINRVIPRKLMKLRRKRIGHSLRVAGLIRRQRAMNFNIALTVRLHGEFDRLVDYPHRRAAFHLIE